MPKSKGLSETQKARIQAGKEAADEVKSEFQKLCIKKKAGPGYIVDNLIRLSRFKAEKSFCYQGEIFYSELLDHPEVQLGALRILGEWQGLKPPDKQEVNFSESIMAAVAAILSQNDPKRKSR